MKKLYIIFILLILTVWSISAQELALDEAITRAAKSIEEELPQRASVLVLNIASPSAAFTNYVLEEITDQLIIGRAVSVVDRQNLSTIRAEMNFQYSGDVSDESMVSIGRMLGAQYIVSGSLTERGINYRLRFRIISIETGRIINSIILDINNDVQVARLIGGVRAVQEAELRQREEERQQQEAERERQRIEKRNLPKTANVRNNWLSLAATGAGVGLRYEHMLGAVFAIGTDVCYNFLGLSLGYDHLKDSYFFDEFGIDLTMRLYPFKKIFYFGTGLGFHIFNDRFEEDGGTSYGYHTISGFSVVPELGLKLDLFKSGGFFIDIGIKIPLVITEKEGLVVGILPYLGIFGWAF